MPATIAERQTLTLSSEELSVLAEIAGAEPLLSWVADELDTGTVSVVVRGLQARGVLQRAEQDDEAGLSVAAALRPLLGVALLADWTTTVTRGRAGESETRTFLRTGEIAVLHEEFTEGLHRFTAATEQHVAAAILDAVPEQSAGQSGTAEAVIPIDDYIRAMRLLGEGDVEAALDLVQGAEAYVDLLATDPETVVVADLGRDAAGNVHERGCSFLVGEAGLWLVTFGETSVTLAPLGAADLRQRLAEFIS